MDDNEKTAQKWFHAGYEYGQNAEYDKAIENYTKAIELKPNLVWAYNNRGNAYGHKDEYDKGIKDLNKAIELKPDETLFYSNKGYIFDNQGKHDEAMQCYDRAIELDSKNGEAYINKGKTLVKLGKEKEAIKCWAKVPQGHKEYYTAQVFMGIYHEDSLIKSRFAEIDKTNQEARKMHDKIEEIANKASDSYEKLVSQSVFKDFREKANQLEKDRKKYAKAFIITIVIDIGAIIGCFFLTAHILSDRGLQGWEYLGQSLVLTSPILVLLLWATKYFNRRTHELVHLKEEYDHKLLTSIIFDGFKDKIEKYGDTVMTEYVMKVINTITENPTRSLYHNKADSIPKNEIAKAMKELNPSKANNTKPDDTPE